jgi:hypothetical protein
MERIYELRPQSFSPSQIISPRYVCTCGGTTHLANIVLQHLGALVLTAWRLAQRHSRVPMEQGARDPDLQGLRGCR